MKRTILLASAAMLTAFLWACKQDDPTPQEVILPEPATLQHAQVITFEETLVIGNKNYSAIELTEGTRYIAALKCPTKAFYDDTKVQTGTYKYKEGKYDLVGLGKMTIGKNEVLIEPTHGYSVTLKAKIKKTDVKTTIEKNACRTWSLNKLRVKVTGPNIAQAVEKEFLGVDLEKASASLRESGVPVPAETIESLNSYVVKEIIITGTNSFVISFTNTENFYGKWNIANDNFYYTIRAIENPIFVDGTTTGKFTFPDEKTGVIQSWAKITDKDGGIYTMEYELTLSENK